MIRDNYAENPAFDRTRMVLIFRIYEHDIDDGEPVEFEASYELPAVFEVCPRCSGKGTIVNPSVDGNGLTAMDFEDDPDFRRDYFSGVYDIRCPSCNGERVIPEVAFEDLTTQQDGVYQTWIEQHRDEERFNRMWSDEIRNGA